MKLNSAIVLGVISMLTFGCAAGISSNAPSAQATPSTAPAKTTTAQRSMPAGMMSGTFVAAEHPTQGMVSVVTENGNSYLMLDEKFKTDKGPDLYVILHRSDKPAISGLKEEDYILIAPLKQVSGEQRYAIPENVNLKDFHSAAIWCRQFNATFGYASLSSAK